MFEAGFRNKFAYAAAKTFQAHFLVGQGAHTKASAFHSLLHAGDQFGVFGIDLPVDAPVQISGRPHFAAIIIQNITYFTDHAAVRSCRQPLHEVDLIGIYVEGDRWPQLEIEPALLVGFRQIGDRR